MIDGGLDLPAMRLSGRQKELIERVAAANANTVVVLQTGGPIQIPLPKCSSAKSNPAGACRSPSRSVCRIIPPWLATHPSIPARMGMLCYADSVFLVAADALDIRSAVAIELAREWIGEVSDRSI